MVGGGIRGNEMTPNTPSRGRYIINEFFFYTLAQK